MAWFGSANLPKITIEPLYCIALWPFAPIHGFHLPQQRWMIPAAHVIGPKLPRISLRNILEASYKWCGYHICPNIYRVWWYSLFAKEIVYLHSNIKELWTASLNIFPKVFWPLMKSMTCQVAVLCAKDNLLGIYPITFRTSF